VKSYRWYHVVVAVFVTSLIVSNIIAVKLFSIGGITLPAGVILFPIAYIIGDVLTEVYGYARAREAIWIGFGCNLLAVAAIWFAGLLPPSPAWQPALIGGPQEAQRAYSAILGFAPRLLLASFVAYLFGEFLNSYTLAKLKIRTQGRFLWVRTIGSTLVGQGVDSFLFITIAFYGILPTSILFTAILSQWIFKSLFEILATPFTYLVVGALKKAEGVDNYDEGTNFSPIKL
jgi:uncharacterized integral membrane protein (TIGR00697 family)